MNYFVIGDIHGCSAQLRILLKQREFLRNRRVIFLGDYVDVGPDTKGVIDDLIAFQKEFPTTLFLRGNHDVALETFLAQGDFAQYAAIGGTATIRAYCRDVCGDVHAAFSSAVPAAHRDFLAQLETFLETEDYLFSHCGYDPKRPMNRSFEVMALQSHQGLFTASPPLQKTAVCGHYFQRTQQPFLGQRVICLDTGCGILGGPLTAALLPERRLVQVSSTLSVQFI